MPERENLEMRNVNEFTRQLTKPGAIKIEYSPPLSLGALEGPEDL